MDRQLGRLALLGGVLAGAAVLPAQAGDGHGGVVIHRAGDWQTSGPAFSQVPPAFQVPPGYVGSIGWGGGLTRTPESAQEQHHRFHEHQQFHHEQFHEHQQFHGEQSGYLYDWSGSQFAPDAHAGWPPADHAAPGQGYQQLQRAWDPINQRSYHYYGPSR